MKFSQDALRKLRTEAGFSQEKMAMLMNYDNSYYNRLESGKRKITEMHLPKIAKALGKDEKEIMEKMGTLNENGNISNIQGVRKNAGLPLSG